jgi:hypothetical protein
MNVLYIHTHDSDSVWISNVKSNVCIVHTGMCWNVQHLITLHNNDAHYFYSKHCTNIPRNIDLIIGPPLGLVPVSAIHRFYPGFSRSHCDRKQNSTVPNSNVKRIIS